MRVIHDYFQTDGGAGGTTGEGGGAGGPIRVLVLNHAVGYGHQSRETGIPVFQQLASDNNIVLDVKYAHQEVLPEGANDATLAPVDLSAFVPGGLDSYDVVFFLNTTGHVFQGPDEQIHQQALQDYMEKRHGGFVGTHSATDTYDEGWQWYQDFIGSIYDGHVAAGTNGSARWQDGVTNPILALAGIPNPWSRSEEWYKFRRDIRGLADFEALLLSTDPEYPTERPHAWVHNIPGGGRMFYTALGHYVTAFQEPLAMQLMLQGIKWAAHRIN